MSEERKSLKPVRRRRNTQKLKWYRVEAQEQTDAQPTPTPTATDLAEPLENPLIKPEAIGIEGENIELEPIPTDVPPKALDSVKNADVNEDVLIDDSSTSKAPSEPPAAKTEDKDQGSFLDLFAKIGETEGGPVAASKTEPTEPISIEQTPQAPDIAAVSIQVSLEEAIPVPDEPSAPASPTKERIAAQTQTPPTETPTLPSSRFIDISHSIFAVQPPTAPKVDSPTSEVEISEATRKTATRLIKAIPIRIITDRPPAIPSKAAEGPIRSTAAAKRPLDDGEQLLSALEKATTGFDRFAGRTTVDEKPTLQPVVPRPDDRSSGLLGVTPKEGEQTEIPAPDRAPEISVGTGLHVSYKRRDSTAPPPSGEAPAVASGTEPIEPASEGLIDVDVSVDAGGEEEGERPLGDEDLEPLPVSLFPAEKRHKPGKYGRVSSIPAQPLAPKLDQEIVLDKVVGEAPVETREIVVEPSTLEKAPPTRATPIPPIPTHGQHGGARAASGEARQKRPSVRPPPAATGGNQPHVPSPPAKSSRTSSANLGSSATASSAAVSSSSASKGQIAEVIKRSAKSARPWWERFFTDDYLRSVVLPTPTQIKHQVDFIESSLAMAHGSTVLDVGCGKGLHAIELTTRGYLVVGLDLSLPMITRAAEDAQFRGLKINFLHADIREIAFDGAFDAAICMGTTFGFFDDEANRDVLARLYGALRPGGRLLIDVVNRDFVIRSQPNLVWFQGDGCVCMEESEINFFTSRLQVKRTMMHEDGRQTEAEYSVRLYSLHELGALLRQMGFRVLEISGQEATRGMFFGIHAPRLIILAERQLTTGDARTAESL
jgi:2-polyprenyl-3-methyl-5-hydroxy-6-metoxy-1,4-benzoquinol methylase